MNFFISLFTIDVSHRAYSLLLQCNADSFTIVLNQLALGIIEVEGLRCILADEHHIELAILQHAWELTLASTKRNGPFWPAYT